MPADLVTGQDAEDVAAYVASVAGVPGSEPPAAGARPSCSPSAAAAATRSRAAGTTGDRRPGPRRGARRARTRSYIEESIVDPNSEITQGFEPTSCPQDFGTSLTPEDLEGLVEYLLDNAGK